MKRIGVKIYKGILLLILLAGCITIIDALLPEVVKQEKFESRDADVRTSSRATTVVYYIKTSHFKMAADGEFCNNVSDSFPVSVHFTPVLRRAVQMSGRDHRPPHIIIESGLKNPYILFFWLVVGFCTILSAIGVYSNNLITMQGCMGASLFFIVILYAFILPSMF